MVMLVFLKQSNFNHVTINEIIAALEPINQRPLKTIGLIRINFTICLLKKNIQKIIHSFQPSLYLVNYQVFYCKLLISPLNQCIMCSYLLFSLIFSCKNLWRSEIRLRNFARSSSVGSCLIKLRATDRLLIYCFYRPIFYWPVFEIQLI